MARTQLGARLLVGMLGETAAAGVAEDVGEEHLGIVAIRLEQHEIAAAIGGLVGRHAGAHPRMEHGAERLREDRRQPTVVEPRRRAGSPRPSAGRSSGRSNRTKAFVLNAIVVSY